MRNIRNSVRSLNQKLIPGMRIAPQTLTKPIEVENNKNKDAKGYIARVFYSPNDDVWFASTNKETKGMVVFIKKKPTVGEKLKIKRVYDNCATAEIVLKQNP